MSSLRIFFLIIALSTVLGARLFSATISNSPANPSILSESNPVENTANTSGEKPAIILIHGFGDSKLGWGLTKSLLQRDGWVVKYFSYPSLSISDWKVPLENIAGDLDRSLASWDQDLQITTRGVIIIAHSMGGLITRYFMAHPELFSYADKVNKLITFGTPNYGVAAALLGDLVPAARQVSQMQYGSEFLWNLHHDWSKADIKADILNIAGARDHYKKPHDGLILLSSATMKSLGQSAIFTDQNHAPGMIFMLKPDHPSYRIIKSYLGGTMPQANDDKVANLKEGMLMIRLFDPDGNPVKVRTIPARGLPLVFWRPNATLYFRFPWWPGISELGYGVNRESGIYYATGADPGTYSVTIFPKGGYAPIFDCPVTIEPHQTNVISLTVYPADASATLQIASGDAPPVAFEETGVTIDFLSGAGGTVSAHRIDKSPGTATFPHLPRYWDIDAKMENDTFTAEMTFEYDDAEILAAGLREEKLTVAFFDSTWRPLQTRVDTEFNKATVTTNQSGLFAISNYIITETGEKGLANLPEEYRLLQNYPNPFNAETRIEYQLPKDSDVRLTIYNANGQFVRALLYQNQGAGFHTVSWTGKNEHQQEVASGVYLYKIEANDFVQTKRLLLMK
jgi:pimeloyl-ACP methyl ester carboxylesterase